VSQSTNGDRKALNRSAAGVVPDDWTVVRSKFLFRERKEVSDTGDEDLLSASHISGISRRSEKDVNMFLAETNEGYKIVRSGEANEAVFQRDSALRTAFACVASPRKSASL
jgi:hypothetical protein